MSTPLHAFITGSFVSDGTAVTLNLPSGVQRFSLYNLTSLGIGGATTPVMQATWVNGMPQNSAIIETKTNGSDVLIGSTIAANGFFEIADSSDLSPGALLSQTATSNAAAIVVSTANTTGLAVGDVVRIIDNTDAQQITGIEYTVTAINGGTSFTLGYGGVAPGSVGSGGFFRRIPFQPPFYPRNRTITNITQAASAVVTLSVTHGYTVGQLVRLHVPTGWGMVEAENQLVTITAINTTTNTITVNLDTTGFTAFTYPSSVVAAGGVGQAQVVPVGMAATSPYENLLDDATRNTAFRGLIIGTAVQTSGETYQWIAERGIQV